MDATRINDSPPIGVAPCPLLVRSERTFVAWFAHARQIFSSSVRACIIVNSVDAAPLAAVSSSR